MTRITSSSVTHTYSDDGVVVCSFGFLAVLLIAMLLCNCSSQAHGLRRRQRPPSTAINSVLYMIRLCMSVLLGHKAYQRQQIFYDHALPRLVMRVCWCLQGQRGSLPSASIMLRQPMQRFTQMQASDIDIYRNEIRKTKNEIVSSFDHNTVSVFQTAPNCLLLHAAESQQLSHQAMTRSLACADVTLLKSADMCQIASVCLHLPN